MRFNSKEFARLNSGKYFYMRPRTFLKIIPFSLLNKSSRVFVENVSKDDTGLSHPVFKKNYYQVVFMHRIPVLTKFLCEGED